MKNLNRLSMHLAAAAVAATAATSASAAIVHRPGVNLTIPLTTNGLYLNVVTQANNLPGSTGGSTVPGWDINPWSTTGFGLFNPSAPAPAGGVYVQRVGGAPGGTAAGNLPFGTLIGPASIYGSNLSSTPAATSGFNLNSSDNIVGFRFFNEATSAVHYGWFRVAFTGGLATAGRTLVEYAYEDQPGVGIQAGAIPAPGAAGLLALGGLVAARRRRA